MMEKICLFPFPLNDPHVTLNLGQKWLNFEKRMYNLVNAKRKNP